MSESSRIQRLLAAVTQAAQRQDRALLADLRHGFGDATSYRAWPHIAPFCRLQDDRDRLIWLTVAAGAATAAGRGVCPRSNRWHNMGDTLRTIALGRDARPEEALRSYEGRFRRLLTCSTSEDLCSQLPTIIRAAANKDVAVNYETLFWDLVKWQDGKARLRWAAHYWGGLEESTADDSLQANEDEI